MYYHLLTHPPQSSQLLSSDRSAEEIREVLRARLVASMKAGDVLLLRFKVVLRVALRVIWVILRVIIIRVVVRFIKAGEGTCCCCSSRWGDV